LKEERVTLLEAWRLAESSFGSFGDTPAVESKMPRKIKMRRMATAEVRVRVRG
jgi:crooked neck